MAGSTTRALLTSALTSWAIAAFFATASVAWAQTTNLDAAKKEGKVVIYGTIVPQVMTLIEKGFEGKYGLKVEYWRADATKVIDRVLKSGVPANPVLISLSAPAVLCYWGKKKTSTRSLFPRTPPVFRQNSKTRMAS
ncbi:MAG TPA: hypothetical protein VLJ79_05110 [Candidatus Binatia bacterium]|nr:hypothetical protein [Candidatus Binatia bacterium]